ncbi:MAG: hypothetical protein ACRDLM_10930 [Gaiellaceae bacterium]
MSLVTLLPWVTRRHAISRGLTRTEIISITTTTTITITITTSTMAMRDTGTPTG